MPISERRIKGILHDLLVGHLEVAGFVAPVALGELEGLVSSLARHHRAFNTCHIV